MTDDWQEAYEEDVNRVTASEVVTPRLGDPDRQFDRPVDLRPKGREGWVHGGGTIVGTLGEEPRWDSDRYETPTPEDAMADGFMAYCTQDDNPYTDDALVRAWEKGFRTAEDFYEGEPCQEA